MEKCKKCTDCGKIKSLNDFHPVGGKSKSLRGDCIDCHNRKKREHQKNKIPLGIIKKCSDCHKNKDLIFFRKREFKNAQNLISICYDNICQYCKSKKYKIDIPNRRQKDRERSKTPKATYKRYKMRSKNNNRNFELTEEEFYSIIFQPCTYCYLFSKNKNFNGLDRVDSKLDYLKTNCVSCCEMCNKMKNNYNVVEFFQHIKKIYEHCKLQEK